MSILRRNVRSFMPNILPTFFFLFFLPTFYPFGEWGHPAARSNIRIFIDPGPRYYIIIFICTRSHTHKGYDGIRI
jgi:hypothetical protein